MGFRLVPKSVTLNDLEEHGRFLCYSTEVGRFGGQLHQKIDPYCLQQKCSTNNLFFCNIRLIVIYAHISQGECVTERGSLVKAII